MLANGAYQSTFPSTIYRVRQQAGFYRGAAVLTFKKANIDGTRTAAELDISQLPHIISRYFVGMTGLQRSHRLPDQLI